MAESEIKIRCASCHRDVRVRAAHAGQRMKCPACGRSLVIPASALRKKGADSEPQHPGAHATTLPPSAGPVSQRTPGPSAAGAPAASPAGSTEHAAAPASFGALPVIITLALCVLLGLATLAFGNLVTGLFILVIALTALNGYWLGFSNAAAGIVGMLVAVALAVPVGRACESLVAAACGTTGLTNRVLSIALCGLLLAMLVTALGSFALRRWLRNKPSWRRVDRFVGAGLGLFEGALLGLLLICAVLVLEPVAAGNLAQARAAENHVAVSPASKRVVALAKVAQTSTVGKVAGALNPLREIPLLAVLIDAQSVLLDPAAREVFLNHPAIAEIRERPSVQRALDLLANDPALAHLKDGVSPEELRSLFDNPRLLRVLDDTHLIAELSSVTEQIRTALEYARRSRE